MVTNTNLRYTYSSLDYYVIMMLQNFKKILKLKFSNFFFISEARSAELKQTTTAKRWLFTKKHVVKRPSKRSALLYNNMGFYSKMSDFQSSFRRYR